MNTPNLSEVGARLEESASSLPPETTPLERYLFYEEISIAILDSEYMDYPEGALESYLTGYLSAKRSQLDISEGDLT